MQKTKSNQMTNSQRDHSYRSSAPCNYSFSSKSSVPFSLNNCLQSKIDKIKSFDSEQAKNFQFSNFDVPSCFSSIANNSFSNSEQTEVFDMPFKLNHKAYNSVFSTAGKIFEKAQRKVVDSSRVENASNHSFSKLEKGGELISRSNRYKSLIKLGPHPSFRCIRLNCLQTSKMLDTNSVEFQLNLISEIKKGIRFSTKDAELIKIPTVQSKSASVLSNNDDTVNNILNYARNSTVLTARSKSSQIKLKQSRKFYCCSSLKNSNKEINKSYLSTNITRKSGNYSVKSMVMNDSLSRFRKKKSASIKSDKKSGTCAVCNIF